MSYDTLLWYKEQICRMSWDEIQIGKLLRVTSLRDVLVDGQTVMVGFEQPHGFTIETENVLQHPMKSRLQKITSLSKQAIKIRTVVFDLAAFAPNAEAHLRR